MTRLFLPLLALLLFVIPFSPAHAETLAPEDTLQSGDLIRGESFASVYYLGEDGFRYVFPNEQTYFTWYTDYSEVRIISDEALSHIQIGGNITYKPGVKMVKFPSDPTVYAVSAGGTLNPIVSEDIARELYGANWNEYIDDLSESLLNTYTIGTPIELASQFDPTTEQAQSYSINSDKQLDAYTLIEITDEGYNSATITLQSGNTVRWLNTSSETKTATEWDRIWGSGTLNPSEHYTRMFTLPGVWHYYAMGADRNIFEGAIIVQ